MVALSKFSSLFKNTALFLIMFHINPKFPRMKLLEHAFQLLCIAGAVGMTAYFIHKYLDDASVVSINSRRFHDTPDDVYPSISICLQDGLFVDTNNVKGSDIAKMVEGLTKLNENFFENITYDDMTTTLQIEALSFQTFQGTICQFHVKVLDVSRSMEME